MNNSTSRSLRWLLLAAVALPALAFEFGMREGRVVFVLYREPKLAAMEALGWGLLTALFWARPDEPRPTALAAAVRRLPWPPLALLLGYGLATVLWTRVRENLFHELGQLLFLFFLVLCLEAWADRDPEVPAAVAGGLVLSLAAATLVGLVQSVTPLAILQPIDPGSGVTNPSVLGYKNPMALALLGQLYLLAHLTWTRQPGRPRRLLVLLLGVELAWLASLGSRTSYLALAGSGLFMVGLLAVRERGGRRLWRAALAAAAAAVLFVAVVAADPQARRRAESAIAHLSPAVYLESDRGTYLLNSLEMVRHNPLGVGFGDWQTWYPVYRRYQRDLYFTEAVQTRKAHSDHVQLFAETGWPGLLLWIWFWTLLLAAPVRRYLATGETAALFLAAQTAAFGLAMATDYVLEHPYGKLEFLLVAFLATRAGRGAPAAAPAAPAHRASRWPALVVSALAAGGLVHAACVERAARLSAALTERYLEAIADPDPAGPRARALLAETARLGDALGRTPAYRKNLCDDAFVLADTARRLGDRERALAWARESLRLHPYSPNAMKMMAALLARSRPAEAARWRSAAEQVLHEATHGFTGPYPDDSSP